MPVKLYGRSHPDPKTLQRRSTLRVMDPVRVKGRRGSRVPCEVHGLKRSQTSKVLKVQGSKGFRDPRDKGFQGI